jgi:GNAT superfamily N-acetyltransferase
MMIPGETRRRARQTILATLSASFACDPAAWSAERNTVVEAAARPGRLRFPVQSRPLALATTGAGVVISCHASRLAWARAELATRGRDELFAAPLLATIERHLEPDRQQLRGPMLRFGCDEESFRPAPLPDGITLTLHEGDEVRALYLFRGFENALEYDPASARPDMLAVAGWRGRTLVGIAGSSADSDDLWQVGVDVVAPERGRGIGRALVGAATAAVISAGKVPYYSTAIGNLHSSAIALGLGYWLAWTEVFARDEAGG